jgi:serine/threonine protein kinase
MYVCANGHPWPAPPDDGTLKDGVATCPECGAEIDPFANTRSQAPTLDSHEPPADPGGASSLPTVAGYRIVREVGRGGMGVVYEAVQNTLNRPVALKMVLSGRFSRPDRLVRFLIEGETLARLKHPNIVQIYEVGHSDGVPFFALEYLGGGTLAQALAGRPQPPRAAAELVARLARAMQHAHAHGVVHRDLKPANVLIRKDEGGRM